jgi:hypothetical protein
MGSGMVTNLSFQLQIAAIIPICSRRGGNGANDIIRAYSPGGRVHDIAGTQGDMIQWPDWRQSDHSGILNDLCLSMRQQ